MGKRSRNKKKKAKASSKPKAVEKAKSSAKGASKTAKGEPSASVKTKRKTATQANVKTTSAPPAVAVSTDAQGSTLSSFDWSQKLPYFALTALGLVVYLLTLCPTIPGGDSSELITVAYTLGIAHPPGYPLFTLLGKLFTFLPFGSVAWRINFLSAVCNVGAALFLMATIHRWTNRIWAGFATSGLFLFSPLIWRYAVVAEVFALNNFFAALLFYLVLRYSQTRSLKVAYLGAFVLGLGLTNHQTLVFYGFPAVLYILWVGRNELWSPRPLLRLAGLFFAGLSVYLYLPITAMRQPIIAWGDLTNIKGFFTHLLRREYGTLQLFASDEQASTLKGVFHYIMSLPHETLYLGFVIAFIAVLLKIRKEGILGFGSFSLLCFLFYIFVFHSLANLPLDSPLHYDVHTRFWQLSNTLMFLWLGLAIAGFFQHVIKKPTLSAAIAVALIAMQISLHYKDEDQSQNRSFEHFAKAVLGPLPKDALVLVAGDIMTNPTRYLVFCEKFRPDLKIIDREMLKTKWYQDLLKRHYPDVVLPGKFYGPASDGGFNLQQFFDANIKKHQIFVNELSQEGSFEKDDKSWEKAYETRPFGFLDRIVTKDTPLSVSYYLKESRAGLDKFKLSMIKRHEKQSWEKLLWNVYWMLDQRRGHYLTVWALKHNNHPEAIEEGRKLLEKVRRTSPTQDPMLYKLLGMATYRRSKIDGKLFPRALYYLRRYAKNPVPKDTDLERLKNFLRNFKHIKSERPKS